LITEPDKQILALTDKPGFSARGRAVAGDEKVLVAPPRTEAEHLTETDHVIEHVVEHVTEQVTEREPEVEPASRSC
jgi:hypothetical protein